MGGTMALIGYNISTGPFADLSINIEMNQEPALIVNTLNAHSYCMAKNDPRFSEALHSSDILLPDGISIVWAAAILRGRRIRKIAGADIHLLILKILQQQQGSCFYLGATEKTLNLISNRLRIEFPGIRVGFFSPPFCEKFSEEDNNRMLNEVKDFNPDVLFVGMTAPKQEKWVHENRGNLKVKMICSIGAAFDFYSGLLPRPSPFWIKCGLEFLPRFMHEPRRLWKRNLVSTPCFLFDLVRFRLGLLS